MNKKGLANIYWITLTHWHLKRPKPPVKDLDISPACGIITINRAGQHLRSNCGAGPDLSNDT